MSSPVIWAERQGGHHGQKARGHYLTCQRHGNIAGCCVWCSHRMPFSVWRLTRCLLTSKHLMSDACSQANIARLTFPASRLSKLTSQTTVLTFSRTSAQQDFVLLHSAAGIGMMWKLVFPFISDDEFYIYHVTFATKNANLANHESSDVSWKIPISLQFFFSSKKSSLRDSRRSF